MFAALPLQPLIDAFVKVGVDPDKAELYARNTGDDIEIDDDGLLVVRDKNDKIIARVTNPGF